MKALRVGLFSECYHPIRNGIVASLDALAWALRARGHEALFVTPQMPDYREVREDLVRVPSLPLPTRTAYRLTMPYIPRSLGDLSIVHAHSAFVTGWLGARAARRARIPLVFTYHTQLEEYAHYVPFEASATRIAASQLTRGYANAADAVIVPTATMEHRLRALGVRTRIEVIPSGIDVGFFARGRRSEALRARFGVRGAMKLVACVGRLGREKNLELAIDAFACLRSDDATLLVIGDGVHRAALERHARRSGAGNRIVFSGEFEREKMPDAYASADALLFTSTSETQGLVLVEGLAAGCAVVAVDTPQTRDVLGGAGALAPCDAPALARELARALMTGGADRHRKATVAAGFDAPALGDRIIDLYHEVIAARARAEAVVS